ncbi:Autophagy-related protein 9 [Linum perenne]
MMFSRTSSNFLKKFKWRWHEDSTLTTGLLNDVAPEIELSGYGRIPSPGSESPSGLLNGESVNVEPIADLDLFFERLYSYYCEKGIWCIVLKWIVELLSLGFTIFFSAFFLLYVDWNGLRNAKCGINAVESGTKPCDLAKEALHEHPLTPLTLSKAVIVGYLVLFSIYLVFCFFRFFSQLKETLWIRQFYHDSLHVTDKEILTMPWATVLEKVVQLQNSQQLCVVKDLSAHDIVMRLMRKENYLIGMVNKGVLAFPLPSWVPGAGPTVKFGSDGTQHRLILTKTLEWTLNWCILQSMFDRNFCVKMDFISNPKLLKKQLMVVGFTMLLLSPFLVIFMLVYLFLRHAEQFYNHPSTASSRRWSNLSRWIFREFNEVDHFFKHRITSSVVHASDYLKQFPSPIISIVAKFVSFVSGGFAAILLIIAFMEESLLEGHIFGRNLFWYAAVFGTITAISRAAVTDDFLVLDPDGAMSMTVQHTHYIPKRWRGNEHTETVRMEFETLFQYTGMMLLEEMSSIFLTPFLLLFVVPKRVDDILEFIADFTVDVEGVGHVCSFSAFDFLKHGNSNYGSPCNAPRTRRSSQGKMEKSMLSFKSNYPTWEPDSLGKQFLVKLGTFREQKLQGPGITHDMYSHHHPELLRGSQLSLRSGAERNTMFPRATPGFQLDSLWLIEADQKNHHPYLLDWYYTSQRCHSMNDTREDHYVKLDVNQQRTEDFWNPPSNLKQNDAKCDNNDDEEEYWTGQGFDDRPDSHLQASTSAPYFRESVIRHHDSTHIDHPSGGSHWWARNNLSGQQPQASFFEPPDFNQFNPSSNLKNLSERSFEAEEEEEEEEQNLDSRNSRSSLYRSAYLYNDDEDIEAGEGNLSLHFDNVYVSGSRPLESKTVNDDQQGPLLASENADFLQ